MVQVEIAALPSRGEKPDDRNEDEEENEYAECDPIDPRVHLPVTTNTNQVMNDVRITNANWYQ